MESKGRCNMDLKDYLTVEEVAERIHLTEERVRELINLKPIFYS